MGLWSEIHEHAVFGWEAIKNGNVCAPTPMSWRLVDHLSVTYVRGPCKHIVELGGGTGRIPRYLTRDAAHLPNAPGLLPPDGSYTVVEINERFIRYMQENIHDSRVRIVHGRAEDIENIIDGQPVDLIFTSLPFTEMPKNGEKILRSARNVLSPGGKTVVTIYKSIEETMEKIYDLVSKNPFGTNIPRMRIQEGHVLRAKIPEKIYERNGKAHVHPMLLS